MISTIQLRDNVKNQLDKMKSSKETYEDFIIRMIHQIEEQNRKQEVLLIEGCKVMAEENLRICKEWENTDATLDWECKGLVPEKYLKKAK